MMWCARRRIGAVALVAVMAGVPLAACGDPVGLNAAAAALELTPADTIVTVGDRVALSLRILDEAGNAVQPLKDGTRPEWRVSDNGVAVVGSAGDLKAAGPGAALVTVTYGHLSAQAQVRVNPRTVAIRVAGAYLVQSVQRRDGGVPLVAGREALLRVFVVADQPNFYRPTVRATLQLHGVLVGSFTMQSGVAGVPTEVREGELQYQAQIPAELVRAGAELVVTVDVGKTVPVDPVSSLRYPASGSLPLDVREVPPFLLRVVPVRLTAHQSTGRIHAGNVNGVARLTLDLYPLAGADVDVRAVYSSDARLDTQEGWFQLAQEMYLLRIAEGSNRYYYGAVELPSGSAAGGTSYGPTRASAGSDSDSAVMAHELGHNFSLPHAPCGTAASDRSFPYLDGSIGHYGFNTRTGQLVSPSAKDIMGYCGPRWISDHHYEKALGFREMNDWDMTATAEPSLILWGRVADGELHLEPVLEIAATPVLPKTAGAYRLEGLDEAGGRIFSLAFDPTPLEGADVAGFLFALPTAGMRPERLARLRLSGPEGVVERQRAPAAERKDGAVAVLPEPGSAGVRLRWWSSRHPLVIVRDRRSGEIVAIARRGALNLPGFRMEDLVVSASDGVQTHLIEHTPD